MDVDAVSAQTIGFLSYVDILGGGAMLLMDLVGAIALLTGRIPLEDLQPGLPGLFYLGGVALVMLVTAVLLIESDMAARPTRTGWLLGIIGTVLLMDVTRMAFTAAPQPPVPLLVVGAIVGIIGDAALMLGGVYLRRLHDRRKEAEH